MRLAAFQMVAREGRCRRQPRADRGGAREAKASGAELLVAPELATTGYGAGDAIRDLAEPADGGTGRRARGDGREHGVAIVAGFRRARR